MAVQSKAARRLLPTLPTPELTQNPSGSRRGSPPQGAQLLGELPR
jgi:hypothetical protein